MPNMTDYLMHRETRELGRVIDVAGGVVLVEILDYNKRGLETWPIGEVQLPSAAFRDEKEDIVVDGCRLCGKPAEKMYCSKYCMRKYHEEKVKLERTKRARRYKEIKGLA